MGPSYAALDFMEQYPNADKIRVTLYGSLAKTGQGHGTDRAVLDTLGDIPAEVVWDMDSPTPVHPNTIDFTAYSGDTELGTRRYYSIGGGEIRTDGQTADATADVYAESTFGNASA